MAAKHIKDKLELEKFCKKEPANSYPVNDKYGWYEKIVPLSTHAGPVGVTNCIDIGIAITSKSEIAVYMTAHCVVGCCGELVYEGIFDYAAIERELKKMDDYWTKDA